jgi:hypothetical protein
LRGVIDGASETDVPHAALLLRFADAVIADDRIDVQRERVLAALSEPAMVDAAAVIAGFDGITRIADATGIQLEPAKAEQTADFRRELGLPSERQY